MRVHVWVMAAMVGGSRCQRTVQVAKGAADCSAQRRVIVAAATGSKGGGCRAGCSSGGGGTDLEAAPKYDLFLLRRAVVIDAADPSGADSPPYPSHVPGMDCLWGLGRLRELRLEPEIRVNNRRCRSCSAFRFFAAFFFLSASSRKAFFSAADKLIVLFCPPALVTEVALDLCVPITRMSKFPVSPSPPLVAIWTARPL